MTTVNISSADSALEQCVQVFEKSSTTEIKCKKKKEGMALSHQHFILPSKDIREKK